MTFTVEECKWIRYTNERERERENELGPKGRCRKNGCEKGLLQDKDI